MHRDKDVDSACVMMTFSSKHFESIDGNQIDAGLIIKNKRL